MRDNGGRIRVLVVDDQVLIRAGLAALLRAAPGIEVAGEAADGEQAITLAAAACPHVVLMDAHMPGTDGISAARQIIATGGVDPPHVLVLTTYDIDKHIYAALRAGARGILLKNTPPERLLAAIAAVAGGDMLLAPPIVHRLISGYAPQPVPELQTLTDRERQVLRLVGKGMSNTQIAAHLIITEATVKTHINRTMTKLDLTSRAQAVVAAYESGLVIPTHEPQRNS
ncbi:response regulator transcription factor [Actinomycetes bacterium KLBMP 9797]